MKTCKKCDLQYDDGKKFCKKCGAPLEGEVKIESKADAKKQVFEEKLKTEPLNVKLLHEYGQFLYENKLFKEAVAICLKIIAIDESDNSAKELLFGAYLNIGEFAKAAETGEELYKPKSRDVTFLLLLANAHQQAGAFPRAVEIYDQVIALQPDNTEAAYQKALALLSQNKAEAAMPIFGRLFAGGKTDRITSIYAGIEKAVNEDHKAAIEILTPVLSDKDTQLNDLDNNRGFVYLAYSLCKTTNDVEKIDKWINLIDLDVLSDYHNSHDEITAAETIVMIFDHKLNYLQNKGERYEIQQRINEYIKDPNSYFTEAARPVFALAWHAAAEKQESFGFYDDAVSSIKKCVELAPDNTEYATKLNEVKQTRDRINNKKKKRKVVTLTSIAALIIIAVAAYFLINRYQDNKAWSAAMEEYTPMSFQRYRVESPDGKYYELSKVIEDSLFWEDIKAKHTISAYESYLQKYQEGKYREDAISHVEDLVWEETQALNTLAAYDKYFTLYPEGKYVVEFKFENNEEKVYGISRYVGQIKDGKREGIGVNKLKTNNESWNGMYAGNWENDKENGIGTEIWINGDRYEGGFKDGKRSGFGTYFWQSGNVYEGEWKNSVTHGTGKYYRKNEDRWYYGTLRNGKGTLYNKSHGVTRSVSWEWF